MHFLAKLLVLIITLISSVSPIPAQDEQNQKLIARTHANGTLISSDSPASAQVEQSQRLAPRSKVQNKIMFRSMRMYELENFESRKGEGYKEWWGMASLDVCHNIDPSMAGRVRSILGPSERCKYFDHYDCKGRFKEFKGTTAARYLPPFLRTHVASYFCYPRFYGDRERKTNNEMLPWLIPNNSLQIGKANARKKTFVHGTKKGKKTKKFGGDMSVPGNCRLVLMNGYSYGCEPDFFHVDDSDWIEERGAAV
ncbi:hypothetical protein GQ43DRAFT_434520 [Delitschia confertaspora ATCC 74209]|uniref:Uncharacterized protein n=1 Tax=Delitschia confertaspora ATCC 74209 TaxID=1513339 RepID=A0A9P4MSL3_9PLEO|nr:hypothetical protein GQ43DRAFT_434520 [Delitschia confertaspora ATCC 74209]